MTSQDRWSFAIVAVVAEPGKPKMMAPHVYEQARATAPIHVQILRTGPAPRPPGASSVSLRGRIVRIFRDHERQVHLLQQVEFGISVINREARGAPEASGTIHFDWEWMGRARWFEAFLQRWEGELSLVRSQIVALRRPTWKPVCGADVKGFLCPGTFEGSESGE